MKKNQKSKIGEWQHEKIDKVFRKVWPAQRLALAANGLALGDVAVKRTEFYRQDRTFA